MGRGSSGSSINGCEFCSCSISKFDSDDSDGICMPDGEEAVSACNLLYAITGLSIASDGMISASTWAGNPTQDSAGASLGSGALGTTLLAVTTAALLRGLVF